MLSRSLWESALELQSYLESQKFRFYFIGGIAVQRWGKPRMTDDVDLTVVVPFGEEREVSKQILARYQSRHPQPLEFALEARILLLQDISGTDIDLSLGGMPFEHRMLERASSWRVPGHGELATCSAEDLVVLKSFAAREQDWIDVENVMIRQDSALNRELIRTELLPLVELKEEPEIVSQLDALFCKYPVDS